MLDLVIWSFVLALSPLALGLAWRLSSGVGRVLSPGDSGSWTADPGHSGRPKLYHIDFSRRHRPLSRGSRWWES